MADFTAGHDQCIQKHYEFYLANKISKKFIIYFTSLCLHAAAAFALTIALTLRADIIAEHSSEDEVLLRRELAQRTCNHETDSLETLLAAENRFMRSLPTG